MTEHERLAALHDAGQWAELDELALALAPSVLPERLRLDPDARQEAALAAVGAVRSWTPLTHDFRQHVRAAVKFAVPYWHRTERRRGLTGRDGRTERSRFLAFDAPDPDASPDDPEPHTLGDRLTYAGHVTPDGRASGAEEPPAGLADPADIVEHADMLRVIRAAVDGLTHPRQRDIVRCVYGIGRFRLTPEEWGLANGVSRSRAYELLNKALANIWDAVV